MNASIEAFPSSDETLIYCNYSQLVNGDSPLGEYGSQIQEVLGYLKGFQPDSIWVFPCEKIHGKVVHQISTCFRLITRIKNDLILSGAGSIAYEDNQIIDCQPPQEAVRRSVSSTSRFTECEMLESYQLAQYISQSGQFDAWFPVLDHLHELRLTTPGLGYLGLWAFIEAEWSSGGVEDNVDLCGSLKQFYHSVFKSERSKKGAFTRRVENVAGFVGSLIGEGKNPKAIRNMLAHGKYRLVAERFSREQNLEFHSMHDELFKLLLLGLEQKIRNAS